jgi:hypothetical protein
VLRTDARVHSDGSCFRGGNSSRQSCELRPLDQPWNVGRQRRGDGAADQVDVSGRDGQPDQLPRRFSRYLPDELPQTITRRPHKSLAAPLGTPDDLVHDAMDAVLFMVVVPVATIAFFNPDHTLERPFIPWLQPRSFLAPFCTCYVHPSVVESYLNGILVRERGGHSTVAAELHRSGLSQDEQEVLDFLLELERDAKRNIREQARAS